MGNSKIHENVYKAECKNESFDTKIYSNIQSATSVKIQTVNAVIQINNSLDTLLNLLLTM